MHILLVNQGYPPDSSSTATNVAELAAELSKHHDVTVVAARPSYDPWERLAWRPIRREKKGRVEVVRLGTTAMDRRQMRGRVLNYLSYSLLAGAFVARSKADIVVAMSDPPGVAFLATLAAHLRGVPLVYNLRDFHPEMALASGMLKPGLIANVWDAMHRWVLSNVDAIIVLGRDMQHRVLEKGTAADRIRIIENTAPIAAATPSPDDPTLREARCGFSFVVCHAGNIGGYGTWDSLVGAARLLQDEGVGLLFVGQGAEQARVQQAAAGLANVRFLPYRPPSEAWKTLAAPDLHVVAIRPGLQGLVVPAKLYPILAARRPVLVAAPADSEPAQLVAEERCGLVVDPESPSDIARAIRWAIANPQELRAMGARARKVAERYTPEVQCDRFRLVLEEVHERFAPVAGMRREAPASRVEFVSEATS